MIHYKSVILDIQIIQYKSVILHTDYLYNTKLKQCNLL